MKVKQIFRNSIISIFISIFIVLYFLFLIQNYIHPNDYKISIVLLIGFAIIITGIFYFFLKIDSSNNLIIKVKILNENAIKAILIFLMAISIFIPAISFSDLIIAWSNVSILNYSRAIIFLIGSLFLPGAFIFKIFFPNSTIHERLNVESFLVKITIYPIISLAFLGSETLILDFIGLTEDSILLFLFFSMIFLFYLDIMFQKKRGPKLKVKITKITISRYTLLILIIGLGIVIIGLGIILSSHQYILWGDRSRAISSAAMIGSGSFGTFDDTYAKYWGCVTYSLSVLCGIPYFNVNVLLFLFLYLSITSVYLLIKILLKNINEKFMVLSSIFIVIMFDPIKLIFQFSFHSFAFFTLFISLTFFFIVVNSNHLGKKSNNLGQKFRLTKKNVALLIFSSLFLVQSLMTYITPAVLGLLTIFLYLLFSTNLKQYLKILLVFYFLFIIILMIFDLITSNFFSFLCFQFLSYFSGIPFNFVYVRPYSLRIALTSMLFYTILLSSFFLLYIFYKFSGTLTIRIKKIKSRINFKLKKKYIYFFVFFFTFFSICLLIANLDLRLLIFYSKTQILLLDFLSFYLKTLMISIGFLGIFGIYLSFFCFKENKNIFLFLFSWFLLIITLASSLIFLRWMQYPTSLVSSIPKNYSFNMLYLFSRIWYYSVIPLSIFTSIGLVKVIQKLKSRSWRYYSFKKINSIVSVSLVTLFIFLSLSTPITKVIYWDNYSAVTDEEAQIFGWISENIPKDSHILIDSHSWMFKYRLQDEILLYNTYFFNIELTNALNNYNSQEEDLYKWDVNTNGSGVVKLIYEEDGRDNIIFINDRSASGNILIVKDFITPQTNGTITFYLKMDIVDENIDAGVNFRIFGENSTEGIDFYINYGKHYYFNDSNDEYNEMNRLYNANEWNLYRINFNCNQNPEYWNVSMNGVQINSSLGTTNFELRGSPVNLSRVQISTTINGTNYGVYLDDFNYSSEPINLENEYILLNDNSKFIYHLSLEDIHYFLIDKKYIDEYQEITDYYYRFELYTYGNFRIYKSLDVK